MIKKIITKISVPFVLKIKIRHTEIFKCVIVPLIKSVCLKIFFIAKWIRVIQQ